MHASIGRYITSIAVSSFIFLFLSGVSYAAMLEFSPPTDTGVVGGTVVVDVIVDAGTQEVAGTDIYISYEDAELQLQSVTAGGYFPLVNNIPTEDRLYISGVVANQGEFQTGRGTVATLTFKPLTSGTSTMTFDCDATQTDTSKIVQNDINATNIIDCTANGSYTLTITGDGTDTTVDGTSGSTTSTGGQLPQSGVYEYMVQYASIGVLMLGLGVGLRLLLMFL